MSGVILGNLPFIGVSYKGHHHEQALSRKFSDPKILITIHRKALQAGIREFAVQIPENEQMKFHWNVLSEIGEVFSDVSFIPNISIPILLNREPLDVYRRWATVLSAYDDKLDAILETVASDRILQCRPNWKELIVKATNEKQNLSPEEISRVKLNQELIKQIVCQLADFRVQFLEFGSEVDFLVASERIDLIGELLDLGQTQGCRVGFGVHHAALTLPKLGQMDDIVGFLTPVNPIGMMMFPTQVDALEAIQNVRDKAQRLIAIKPLAGGHYPQVAQCLAFLANQGIKRIMVGVSSLSELQQVLDNWNQFKKS